MLSLQREDLAFHHQNCPSSKAFNSLTDFVFQNWFLKMIVANFIVQ